MITNAYKGKSLEIGLYSETVFKSYFSVDVEKIIVEKIDLRESNPVLSEKEKVKKSLDYYCTFLVSVQKENIYELKQIESYMKEFYNLNFTAKTEAYWYDNKENYLLPCEQHFYKLKFESFIVEYNLKENYDICEIKFKMFVPDTLHVKTPALYETKLYNV